MANKSVLQFSTNRGHLHFQYGSEGSYAKFDQPFATKKGEAGINLKGLKTTTSLAGTSTTYYVVPQSHLASDRREAFKAKRGFSLAKVAAFVKSTGK